MTIVVEILLTNACLATALAALAAAVAPFVRRPAVRHAIWLLVLLRLLAPPIVGLPFAPAAARESTAPAPAAPISEKQVDPYLPASPDADSSALLPAAVLLRTVQAEVLRAARSDEKLRVVADLKTQAGADETSPVAAGAPSILVRAFLCIWLAGSAAWFAYATVCSIRFSRALRLAAPAPELDDAARSLARDFGLRRAPPVTTWNARIPPLLWPIPPRIVLPVALVAGLDAEQRRTLLAHELAHYRRGDHWVRWIEAIAGGLFWWLPTMWLVRRALRRAEEDCCDAWVVALLPASAPAYGRTLVDALDFLVQPRIATPALASGMGEAAVYQRRLQMILHAKPNPKISRLAAAWLATAGLFLLGVAPRLAASDPPAAEKPRTTKIDNGGRGTADQGGDDAAVRKTKTTATAEAIRFLTDNGGRGTADQGGDDAAVRKTKTTATAEAIRFLGDVRIAEDAAPTADDRVARLEAMVQKLAQRLDAISEKKGGEGADKAAGGQDRDQKTKILEKMEHDKQRAWALNTVKEMTFANIAAQHVATQKNPAPASPPSKFVVNTLADGRFEVYEVTPNGKVVQQHVISPKWRPGQEGRAAPQTEVKEFGESQSELLMRAWADAQRSKADEQRLAADAQRMTADSAHLADIDARITKLETELTTLHKMRGDVVNKTKQPAPRPGSN